MTVVREIEKAIAMAEASKGNYLLFASDSEDQQATRVFRDMAQDMERHVQILESRREYLTKHNNLNAAQGQAGQQEQGVGGQQNGLQQEQKEQGGQLKSAGGQVGDQKS